MVSLMRTLRGLTTATGKWANAFQARLVNQGLTCHVKNGDDFTIAMLEKHVWICAFMLVGASHGGCTVGEVESTYTKEFEALASEMMRCWRGGTRRQTSPTGAYDRLAAYARAVSHFPTAVKEFEWRNGWFYKLTCDAVKAGKEDPGAAHAALPRPQAAAAVRISLGRGYKYGWSRWSAVRGAGSLVTRWTRG